MSCCLLVYLLAGAFRNWQVSPTPLRAAPLRSRLAGWLNRRWGKFNRVMCAPVNSACISTCCVCWAQHFLISTFQQWMHHHCNSTLSDAAVRGLQDLQPLWGTGGGSPGRCLRRQRRRSPRPLCQASVAQPRIRAKGIIGSSCPGSTSIPAATRRRRRRSGSGRRQSTLAWRRLRRNWRGPPRMMRGTGTSHRNQSRKATPTPTSASC
jgi:hypothetical protein